MRKEFIQGFIYGMVVTTLFFGISSLIHKEPEENKKNITHIQMVKKPLKKGIAEVFYPQRNETQFRLANKILDILVKEYELVAKVIEIPEDKILSYQTYGLVFCEDIDDMFLKYTHHGLTLVDGVQCYPVVGEVGFPFRDPKTRFRLVNSLPQELVKGILREKLKEACLVIDNSGRWFIEGIGGYMGFLCWQRFDKYAFFNYEYPRVLKLFDNAPSTIDLTDYETFKEDDLSCYAATFIIIDLVNRYGRGIIAKSISNLTESKEKVGAEEIAGVIKELTGADILPGLKVVSVKRVEERFKLLKTKLL